MKTNKVEYKDVPGFPGYRVGSDGSIWSNRRSRYGMNDEWKQLKPYKEKPKSPNTTYYLVSLRRDNRRAVLRLHQIVMLAFVGEKPDGMVIRHLNNNGLDNRIENLKYGTVKENAEDMIACGASTFGEKNPCAKLTEEQVRYFKENCKPYSKDRSQVAFSKLFGVSQSVLSAIACGRTWSHVA